MNKIKVLSFFAFASIVVTTAFLWTSEKKPFGEFVIKFYDKSFPVSWDVLNQFGVFKTQKEFFKFQEILPKITEKQREFLQMEKRPQDPEKAGKVISESMTQQTLVGRQLKKLVGEFFTTEVFDITSYVKDLMPENPSEEAIEKFSQLIELLLNIASGTLSPEDVEHSSTLFVITKIADELGNNHVMRLCAGPLMKKITGIEKSGPTHTFKGHKRWVTGLVLLPGKNQFFSSSLYGRIKLWSFEGGNKSIKTFEGHKGRVTGLVLLPGENKFLSWSRDGEIKLWSLEGELIHTFLGHTNTEYMRGVTGLVLLPGKKQFLSWSDDGTIRLWSLEGQELRTFSGHEKKVKGVVLLPGGNQFLSWSDDGTIRLWDINPFENLTFQQIEFCYDLFEIKEEMSFAEGSDEFETFQSLPEFLRDEIIKRCLVTIVSDDDEEEEGEVG